MNLNQVTVGCTEVARSVAFYRRLGLIPIVLTDHYARFVCPDGEASFSIHRVAAVAAGETTVFFECADLDGDVARLKAVGVAFENDPVDEPWLWRQARLRDPDGNRLCLFHAGVNRLDPPWRVREADPPLTADDLASRSGNSVRCWSKRTAAWGEHLCRAASPPPAPSDSCPRWP